MNTLFIDVIDFSSIVLKKGSAFGISKLDIISHFKLTKYSNVKNGFDFVLFIDSNYDKLFIRNVKIKDMINNIIIKRLNNAIRKNIEKLDNLNVIFSKEFSRFCCNSYVLEIITRYCNFCINVIEAENNMLKHDMRYISNYLDDNNLKKDDIHILVILKDINDTIKKKIIEYIEEYKFLDILVLDEILKFEYSKIYEFKEYVNNEYGTAIEIINYKKLEEYNVCISYSNILKDSIISRYIFSRESIYIDINNKESDYLDDNLNCYMKNENEIKKYLKTICININRYNKNDLGKLYKLYR